MIVDWGLYYFDPLAVAKRFYVFRHKATTLIYMNFPRYTVIVYVRFKEFQSFIRAVVSANYCRWPARESIDGYNDILFRLF